MQIFEGLPIVEGKYEKKEKSPALIRIQTAYLSMSTYQGVYSSALFVATTLMPGLQNEGVLSDKPQMAFLMNSTTQSQISDVFIQYSHSHILCKRGFNSPINLDGDSNPQPREH